MNQWSRLFKLLFCASIAIFLAVFTEWGGQVRAYSSGPPPARTGAPGEITCTVCHSSYPLNSGSGVLRISGLPESYLPGQEILLSVSLTEMDRGLFGFELTAVDESGRRAGDLVIVDDFRTQSDIEVVNGNIRQYIKHTLAGTRPNAPNQGSWNFKWKAPPATVGKVIFYIAGNAANGNGGLGGDYIYNISASINDGPVETGWEGDVAPRPAGSQDGSVTLADWMQIGRFAAGLDIATEGSEFARADCAPVSSRGDGRITIHDWVQAGRFAMGFDPFVTAGGATKPISGEPGALSNLTRSVDRSVADLSVEESTISIDGQWRRTVSVLLNAHGMENALGFSLEFDPEIWRAAHATTGAGAPEATLIVNSLEEGNGRLGFMLALPAGQSFAEGMKETAVVIFISKATGAENSPGAKLIDSPIYRDVVGQAKRQKLNRLSDR